jgi:hypothetical protein
MTEPQSGADILARIKPVRREETTELCMRPDLLDRFDALVTELDQSRVDDVAGKRLTDSTSKRTREIAEQIEALKAEITETVIVFRLRALNKAEWSALVANHPPRSDNHIDHAVGYNRDAVDDAAVQACIIDPDFDDLSWAQFMEVCNPSEWEELRDTARSVNRAVRDVPKSAAASRILARGAST